jgi:hypothetical protein
VATPVAVRPKQSFVEFGLLLGGESPRLSNALSGNGSTRQSFGDLALSLLVGKDIAPYAKLFGYADLGLASSRYATMSGSWSVGLSDLTLAPGIRLHTRGKRLRLFGDIAAGLGVRWVGATSTGTPSHVSGSGAGLAFVADAGLEMQLRAVYLSAAMVLLVHDVGAVRDSSGEALFADSGATRLGVRLMAGFPF